jgi:hypothetical protein
MRVVITRAWQVDGSTPAKLDVGQVFEVRESMAIYLFALRCAERASDVRTGTPEPVDPQHQPTF